MNGGRIFRKPNGDVAYYDQITIGLYSFDVNVRVREKRGDPSAIRCGRIVTFEMTCEDELVAYFDDGQWLLTPDGEPYGEDEFTECVRLGRDLMIQKWSNPERIRANKTQTELL